MTVAKTPRPYRAPRRAEQAAATREAIITAASRLFGENGYAATTMAAIAAAARVTPKSVYSLAEKPQLLLLAVDRAIVGDDEPTPLADRPGLRAVRRCGSRFLPAATWDRNARNERRPAAACPRDAQGRASQP